MTPLLELQRAVARAILNEDDIAFAPPDRVAIYRNTFDATVAKALRLTFPAVHRLVGEEFFAGAAAIFARQSPPAAGYLDLYGAAFPDFLAQLPQAAGLPYLPGVARLEWAVSRALHAGDAAFPAAANVSADYPADAIWRAVLLGDDDDLAALDVNAGPVTLKVWRSDDGIEVVRQDDEGSIA